MRAPVLAVLTLTLILGGAARADDAPAKAPAEVAVPYRLTDTKHVMVRVKINGKGPFNLILDTGAPAVFIPKKVAKKVGVETDGEGWGTFDSFELEGGLKVAKTKTRVSDLFQLEGMNGMGLAGVELHGVIGYNVLAQFRITYDFTADQLVFGKLGGFKPPSVKGGGSDSQGSLDALGPLMKTLAGFMGIKPDFTIAPRGSLGVTWNEVKDAVILDQILPGSPADKAGLKSGDKVEAVALAKAGKSGFGDFVDIDRPRDLTKLLATVKAGQKAQARVARGGETLTLTLTFGKGL